MCSASEDLSRRPDNNALVGTRAACIRAADRFDEPRCHDDAQHDDEGDGESELKDFPNVRDLGVHTFVVGILGCRP